MKYIVYQTINKENGKIYIGVHKTVNPDIFDGYIGNGVYVGYSLENPKTPFQYALKKYGYGSFIRTVIKSFDEESEAYDLEAKLVSLEFIRMNNNYNIKTGGIHGLFFKTLYQFDLNGTLLKTWTSVSEAIEYYSSTRFHSAAIGKYSAFESYWSYADSIDVSEYRRCVHSCLYQFSFTGILIKVYKNSNEAIKETAYKGINEAVSKKLLYKECYWTKDPDNIFMIIKNDIEHRKTARRIYEYENNEIVNEYIKLSDASKQTGIESKEIRNSIKSGSEVNGKRYDYRRSCLEATKIAQYDMNTNELVKVWNTITECAKIHPKCRDVLKGGRNHTHGYIFKYIS